MSESKQRAPISLEIYKKIKYDILENNLKPGEKLIEEDLAFELKVSRTPVREALKQLDQDGLVTYYPRRGSIVSEISLEDAVEIYEVREVLEGLAIKLICINGSRLDVGKLRTIMDKMEVASIKNEYEYMTQLHREWSETILSLTPNDVLKGYLTTTMENLGRLRKISLYMPEHSLDAYMETRDILEAILENNSTESERLAKLHVRKARNRFEKNILKNNDR